ncbi:hypothetical protein J6590_055230 [Homalodisca vitripennis]|nr:hypothetical protein J6590_055230 [Homalodisca vitripennis]
MYQHLTVSGKDLKSGAFPQVGDCVLEVNGEDVLGLRVSDIAARVRARELAVTLLLWNSGTDPTCDPERSLPSIQRKDGRGETVPHALRMCNVCSKHGQPSVPPYCRDTVLVDHFRVEKCIVVINPETTTVYVTAQTGIVPESLHTCNNFKLNLNSSILPLF